MIRSTIDHNFPLKRNERFQFDQWLKQGIQNTNLLQTLALDIAQGQNQLC